MIKRIWHYIVKFVTKLNDDHLGAYSSQSAYFMILSFIPFLLLLMTLIRYLPITEELTAADGALNAVPVGIQSFILGIIEEVYAKSNAVLPVTAIVALWSAAKGFQALSNGLNVINGVQETRNFIYMRIRSILYTLVFILAIILTLILMVFGRSIQKILIDLWPFVAEITNYILRFSTIITMFGLAFVFLLFYTFLPNRKQNFTNQIPGALFTAVAWSVFSFGFSMYLEYFPGFADMYGSLTTIILLMLWLYFCMYLFLLGAEINVVLEEPENTDKVKDILEDVMEEVKIEAKEIIHNHVEDRKREMEENKKGNENVQEIKQKN